jgi:hypothetical protein
MEMIRNYNEKKSDDLFYEGILVLGKHRKNTKIDSNLAPSYIEEGVILIGRK